MKWKDIHKNPSTDQHIVALLNYKDMVLVATPSNLWVIKDGKIEEAEFVESSN